MATSRFAADYDAALGRHVDSPGEHGLEAAYELGRRALHDGIGLVELIALHHRACLEREGQRRVGAADAFVREALAAFEIASRGYAEAQRETAVERERLASLRSLADAALAVTAGATLHDRVDEVVRQAVALVDAAAADVDLDPGPDRSEPDGAVVIDIPARAGPARLVVVPRPGQGFTEADRATLTQLALFARGAIDDAQQIELEQHRMRYTDRRRELSDRMADITTLLAVTATPDVMMARFLDVGPNLVGAGEASLIEPPPVGAVFDADRNRAILPLSIAGRECGLVVNFADRQEFDDEQMTFLVEVADRLGSALDRADLYRREQDARLAAEAATTSIQALQRFAADLVAARSRIDVAELVLTHARAVLAADVGAVLAPTAAGIEVLAQFGLDDDRPPPAPLTATTTIQSVLRTRHPLVISADDPEPPEIALDLATAGIRSASLHPLSYGHQAVAVLAVGWTDPSAAPATGGEFLDALLALAAQGFERARVGDVDHLIASTLQRQFLSVPTPARLAGVRWSGRYRTGLAGTSAGGDWFDVVDLGEGQVGFFIGDVVGHGIDAAGQMGQLRSAARALAGPDPGRVLDALDRFVVSSTAGQFASVAYVVVDRARARLSYAVAGHPPPVVFVPDVGVQLLDDAAGIVLAAETEPTPRSTATIKLIPGSTLVLYTDGLVERRTEAIDEGVDRLAAALDRAVRAGASAMPGAPATFDTGARSPEEMADSLVADLLFDSPGTDDIALLVVSVDIQPPFEVAVAAERRFLKDVRDSFRAWLGEVEAPLNDSDREDLVLGLSEAVANAMEHGAPLAAVPLIEVEARLEDGAVLITVHDAGRWLGESSDPDRGRGLMIMHGVFDTVDIDSSDAGTRVTLSRHLRPVA